MHFHYVRSDEEIIAGVKQVDGRSDFGQIVRWRPDAAVILVIAQPAVIVRYERLTLISATKECFLKIHFGKTASVT